MQVCADRADTLFIEGNTGRRRLLNLLPLRLLETHPRAIGDLAKMLTVIVKAIEDKLGDSAGGPLLWHEKTP